MSMLICNSMKMTVRGRQDHTMLGEVVVSHTHTSRSTYQLIFLAGSDTVMEVGVEYKHMVAEPLVDTRWLHSVWCLGGTMGCLDNSDSLAACLLITAQPTSSHLHLTTPTPSTWNPYGSMAQTTANVRLNSKKDLISKEYNHAADNWKKQRLS